jgi:hypothetical protein
MQFINKYRADTKQTYTDETDIQPDAPKISIDIPNETLGKIVKDETNVELVNLFSFLFNSIIGVPLTQLEHSDVANYIGTLEKTVISYYESENPVLAVTNALNDTLRCLREENGIVFPDKKCNLKSLDKLELDVNMNLAKNAPSQILRPGRPMERVINLLIHPFSPQGGLD